MGDPIPAATLTVQAPPAIRLEVEAGADTSIEDAWARLRESTPKPSPEDWVALVRAERISRMAWLADEDSGAHRKKKTLGDFMSSPKPAKGKKHRGDGGSADGGVS